MKIMAVYGLTLVWAEEKCWELVFSHCKNLFRFGGCIILFKNIENLLSFSREAVMNFFNL